MLTGARFISLKRLDVLTGAFPDCASSKLRALETYPSVFSGSPYQIGTISTASSQRRKLRLSSMK